MKLEEERKKLNLPQIGEDGTWTEEIRGVTYKFREEKVRERSQVANEARQIAPYAPEYEETVRLLAIVVQRQNPDGKWEQILAGELMEKDPRFLADLSETYKMGQVA